MKLFVIYIVLFTSICGCNNRSKETPEQAGTSMDSSSTNGIHFSKQQIQAMDMEIGTPRMEELSGTITLQGKIDVPPQSTISLSFPLGGYLKSTDALPGMHIKKGQVLGVMEDMQFIQLQQDYLTAKERFRLAETEYTRQQELNATKATSDKVFQQAKSELETQRILMNSLAQKLALIGIQATQLRADNISRTVSIHSPIDGFVAKVNVNVGKYTSPTDMLFELVDPRDIHLALNVFEKDLSSLAIGQQVTAFTNNNSDKKYPAEIILISQNISLDRTAEVHCHFEQYDRTLIPGMFMNGEVAIAKRPALTVPEEAVVRWKNAYYVFVDQGKQQFEMTEVKPGVAQAGFLEIEGKDIDVHTSLIVKNAYAALMKLKNTEEEGE